MAAQGAPNSGSRNGFIFMAVIFILFGLLLAFFVGNRLPGLFEFFFGERLESHRVESPESVDANQLEPAQADEVETPEQVDSRTPVERMNDGDVVGQVVSQTNDYGTAAIAGN